MQTLHPRDFKKYDIIDQLMANVGSNTGEVQVCGL
ncbi:hypothetical protein SAMN05421790_105237 [Kroppenstedtia eburnea]|uniref:Uncharacterized protein n=1 Tax=Kroppenstedtia eburnea TaxID=714067 RepID=A0A1N7M6M8_9BACL|nr:hypothetical protein SAMN05421790_105237 [Kroppenstedtia eburnea]